jgi:transcriptional regulator with XRE-family HTH domain
MDNDDSTPSEPLDLRELSPQDAPTINQLVAYNMTRARRSRGWTQQEVADRLEKYTGRPWSKASISAAERAWQGGRPRKFDANELVALSVIFETPVAYFLLPMQEGNSAVVMAQPEDQKPGGFHWMGVELLLKRVLMDEITSRGGSEFFVRAHDAVLRYLDADWRAPAFLEKRLPAPFPPGYRFGDPLEDEDVTGEDEQEAEGEASKEAKLWASAEGLSAILRPGNKDDLLDAIKQFTESVVMHTVEHLEESGFQIVRKPEIPPAQTDSKKEGRAESASPGGWETKDENLDEPPF